MKKYFKRFVAIEAIILISAIQIFGFIDRQQSNYSGIWKRNAEKTDPGNLSMNSVPLQLEIAQTDKEIKIKRISKDRLDSSFVYTEILNADGSMSSSVPKLGIKKNSSFQSIPNSGDFIDIADFTDNQGNLIQKVKETWSIEDSGKTLRIAAEINANGKTYLLTEIFDKQ